MELARPLPSDGQLAEASRRGSAPAWAELDSRHGSAVHAVAKERHDKNPRRAAREAMARLHRSIVEDPPVDEGAAAVRAFRPLAIAALTGGEYGPAADANRLETDDAAVLAAAFARLPEPWQTVLWHSVVEHRSAGEMTPLLGRGVNDVLALLHTARSGLHQAYLRAIADLNGDALAAECRPVVPLLSAAGRGTLAAQEQRIVDAHILAGRDGAPCRECRARLDLVGTIDERLPAAIVPGITGLSVARYRKVIGVAARSFGAAALDASRSNRSRRMAIAGAVAVIVLAAAGALFLIRPFDQPATGGPTDGPTTPGTSPTVPPVTTADVTTAAPVTTAEPTAATTTELPLRPPPTGPANVVELIFAGGTRALGASTPELGLDVGLSSPGSVFAGGTGTIDVIVTNTAGEPNAASFEIRTPGGLLFDALVGGAAECRGPREDAAFCNVTLDAGEVRTITVRLRLESDVVGRLIVDPGPAGDVLEVGIAAVPRLVHSSVGHGDVLMIGNTVISCADSAPECPGARDLTGPIVNRWDVPMEFVGASGPLGWDNSSSAMLDLPPGAGVEAAYLFWSGDLEERGRRVADDGGRERVTVLAPNADRPVPVTSDRLLLGDVDATQYLGYADVTDLVAAGGSGGYHVANVSSVEVQGSYAGWSLVVVTDDDRQPRRQHVVTSPFAWFAPDYRHVSVLPMPVVDGRASLDVLGFEGEPGFFPERFAIDGSVLGGDNLFDGSLRGERSPSFVNNFGIDIEAYDLAINASDGTLTIDATSDKDGVRLAVVGLAVDLPS